jgi:hypothetical protein
LSFLILSVGVVLVSVALVDVTWTTLAAGSGAGPITGRLAGWLWQVSLRIHRWQPSHRRLSVAGVLIIVVTFTSWIVLVLCGWSLVFSSTDGAVRAAQTGRPAGLVERLYFTGYTMFTLGNGEYRPGKGSWQLATVVATSTGLILVTLGITYLVPVASAVASRRQLASYVASLGTTSQEIVTNAWTGTGFGSLSQHLVSLAPLVQSVRQQHLTYPVLHYFHSQETESATAINVANLSQAVHLLRHGVAPEVRLDQATTGPVDRAIGAFLEILRGAHLSSACPPIGVPDLAPLRAAGVPTVDDAAYARTASTSEPRRTLVAALLTEDGWPAPEATAP